MSWDWNEMVERNRALLLQALLRLFVLAGLTPGGQPVPTLAQGLRLTLLRLIRPTEAAVRRLIFIAAQGMTAPEPYEFVEAATKTARGNGKGSGKRAPGFPLSDPRLRVGRGRKRTVPGPGPRMGVIGLDDHVFADPPKPEPVDSTRLCQRMLALHRALEDIPGYAKRLLRRRARAEAMEDATPIFVARASVPMRPGRPPGYRRLPQHEIDELLQECHALALQARDRWRPAYSSV